MDDWEDYVDDWYDEDIIWCYARLRAKNFFSKRPYKGLRLVRHRPQG